MACGACFDSCLSDAPQIRDEILNIMHRNHIPEMNGTWMEQWHQKLVPTPTHRDPPARSKAVLSTYPDSLVSCCTIAAR